MKVGSLWPPRRVWDRVAADYYYRRNPRAPWLPRVAAELLSDLLRATDRCLEWGSGSSTAWLIPRVQSVVSIEHDPAWFERVRRQLAADGRDTGSVRRLSIDPVDDPAASPYVRVIDDFAEGDLDVCFVDGEHRAICALAVIPKLVSGGLLVLDDAHGFLDHPTSSPHSRHGLGPLDAEWRRFAELVSAWRGIWASDGSSDTAIWIKP